MPSITAPNPNPFTFATLCIVMFVAMPVSLVVAEEKFFADGDQIILVEQGEIDPAELRRRAEAGDPDAQYEVGYAYFTGNGTKQSYKRARKWYERAAKQGHAGAQFNLGLIYLDGIGTSRRDILGLAWMYVAAAQTDTANGRIAQAFVEKFEAEMAEWAKLGWDDSVIIFGKEKAEELASEIKRER